MDHSKLEERHKIQSIARIAQDIRLLCNIPESQPSSNCDVLASLAPQLIPNNATSIAVQLQEIGVSSAIAEEVSTDYLKACSKLRSMSETSLRNAVASSKDSITIQYMVRIGGAVLAQQTKAWAESAFSRARASVAKAQSYNISQVKKPTFNHVRDCVL